MIHKKTFTLAQINTTMKNKLLLFFTMLILIAGAGNAQIRNIYNFSTLDNPAGSLTPSGNLFYGMANQGGDSGRNEGYIFSVNKNGTGFKQIWNFYDSGTTTAFHANGSGPQGSLILNGNKLYGMTERGGANHYGLVFSINTDGSGYKDLWDFADTGNYAGNVNGYSPWGSLLLIRNRLYGMTNGNLGGGGIASAGNIFSIDTNGGGYKDMLDFSNTLNGAYPYGSLILLGGKLFGTTYGNYVCECGGREESGAYGYGNVFSIDTNGKNYKDVYVFAGPNGSQPYSNVTVSQNGKRIFGTTYSGGTSNDYGVVFAVDTDGGNYKVLVNFDDTNGAWNLGNLTLNGNTLYGMTPNGGSYIQYNGSGFGNIYSIDTNGSNFKTVFNFNLSNGANSNVGSTLIYNNDSLYGMTPNGGFDADGVIFACALPTVTTGIQNSASANGDVAVYPNPTSGQFTIKSVVSGQWSVKVYNVMGQEVYSQFNISNSTFNVDMGTQASGVYMYRILSLDGNAIGEGKIIVQK